MMSEIIIDKTGQKIQLRRVGVLETMRLFKVLGPELSENTPYLNLAVIASSIEMIDGVPVPFPGSIAGVESIIARIGDDNIKDIALAIDRPPSDAVIADAGN